MLFSLVKKDFMLLKKYLLLLIVLAIGEPLLMASQNFSNAASYGFYFTAFFLEYIMFGMVATSEEKCNASVLLCATPYTRNMLVRAKYLSMLVILILNYIIYTVLSFIDPARMGKLSIFTLGTALLILAIFFGIIIPIQYKFGYVATKFILGFVLMLIIVATNIIKRLPIKNINLQLIILFSPLIQGLFLCFIALVIGCISMTISMHIYSKKDL